MIKKLFLICPNGQMEHFIKDRFGEDAFFLTALGGVFNFQEVAYAEALADFIERESIAEVFIVNDTSCRFIESVLEKKKGYDTAAEQIMLHLLIDNYYTVMEEGSLLDKKKSLAKLNVRQQAFEMLSNELLLTSIVRSKVRLKGLVTTKAAGKIKEINVELNASFK